MGWAGVAQHVEGKGVRDVENWTLALAGIVALTVSIAGCVAAHKRPLTGLCLGAVGLIGGVVVLFAALLQLGLHG